MVPHPSATPHSTGIHPLLVALVRHARGGNGRRSSVSRGKPEPRLYALGCHRIPEVSLVGHIGGASEVRFGTTSGASVGREHTSRSVHLLHDFARAYSKTTVLIADVDAG